MKRDKKTLVCIVAYNTAANTASVLKRVPRERSFDILVVNDGSTDQTQEIIEASGFNYIRHEKNRGVGAAIKSGISYGLENNYYAIAVLAGNNKDNPTEASRLLAPILDEAFDYIQGSRFADGGRWDNLPSFRFVMIKAHALFFSLLTGKKCTDALNGFRAYRLEIFRDERINIWQDWLDKYELETYLHYKVLRLGYLFKEVAVSKIYPRDRKVKYSHIRPFIDWWVILRPLLFLALGMKK